MVLRRQRSDVELLAAAETDGRAFGAFYRRHERAVLRFFLHWSGSPEVAADLTAETFARAFESLRGYREERGEPRAWLFGIGRNVLARSRERGKVEDECRQRLGMPVLAIDDAALERINALDGDAVTALEGLRPALRDAVVGRVVQDRSYAELARDLACSESVVRQRVHRGLARLRNRLEVRP